MRLKLEYPGRKRDIYSVVLSNGESPALEFLNALRRRDPGSHKTMVRRYKDHADNGPSRNIQHSRSIRGRSNLYEFKTRQGDRLLYFYHPKGMTVLTNGFHKGDPPEPQFDRAERLRDTILAQEGSNGTE